MGGPDQRVFGWRVRSAIPLPELQPWDGDEREPDLTIVLGSAAPLLEPYRQFGPAAQIGDDVVRVVIPGVATYLVEGGRRIVIETDLPTTAPGIRVFLLGTVLAVISFQRSRLPLHASVLDVDGRALVLAGDSGAGKSTMAAALVARGFRILSDDLCLLDTGPSGPMIQPAYPRLRLWKETATHLGLDTTGIEQAGATIEKHHFPVAAADFHPAALPPALVVGMRFAETTGAGLKITPVGQGMAMRQYFLIHRWQLGLAMGQQPVFFAAMADLVRHCPMVTLERPRDFALMDETVDRLLDLARGGELPAAVA
jgi:hypothetical protein